MYDKSNLAAERNSIENICQNRKKKEKEKVEIGDTEISI